MLNRQISYTVPVAHILPTQHGPGITKYGLRYKAARGRHSASMAVAGPTRKYTPRIINEMYRKPNLRSATLWALRTSACSMATQLVIKLSRWLKCGSATSTRPNLVGAPTILPQRPLSTIPSSARTTDGSPQTRTGVPGESVLERPAPTTGHAPGHSVGVRGGEADGGSGGGGGGGGGGGDAG